MRHAAERADATPFDVRALWDVNDGMFDVCGRANRAWLDGIARAGAQTTAFWNGQFEKGVSALAAMGRCTDPGEALAIEARFAADAMTDCFAEGQRLMQMMADLAQQSGLPGAVPSRTTHRSQ
ncbi:MAG: phasin family protein [Burkholderiales bacterium]